MEVGKVTPVSQQTQRVAGTPKQSKVSDEMTLLDQVSLGSEQVDRTLKTPSKWVVMHYTAADNNLKDYLVTDVNEMEQVGSSKNLQLLALVDQGGDNCKLYHLQRDEDSRNINSPVVKDYGSTNMADPKTLTDFIVTCMKKFPAEHYCLVMGDHGKGWKGAIADDSHKSWMTLPQIREGLDEAREITGRKLDVLGFDACLMATGEVAYELRDAADYMVASQETEHGSGWPYASLLTGKSMRSLQRAVRTRFNMSPEDVAMLMVDNAHQHSPHAVPTLSALDMSLVGKYEEAVNGFADALLKSPTPGALLKEIARETQGFDGYGTNSRDQFHFLELIVNHNDIKDEKLKETAKVLMETIDEMVVKNQRSKTYPNANGVTIEIPISVTTPREYQDLRFAQETRWDNAVARIRHGKDNNIA